MFAAMFEHPVKENMTGIVNISDIEVDVFQELLHYIYTGQVTSKRMDEVAAGLFAAADNYLLTNLKKTCGDHLIKLYQVAVTWRKRPCLLLEKECSGLLSQISS